jgi:CBS domain containing-hemolysin-like protein
MVTLLFGIICAALALVFLALLKTYQHVPAKELKRMARRGDVVASLLYKPVAYGLSLQILLWFIVGLAFAGSVVLFSKSLPSWLAVFFVALVIWVGFAWIPTGNLTKAGVWLARRAAPPIAWLLERLHPISSWLASFIRVHRPVTVHTGLYQKSDLADLLTQQKDQPDNRIPTGEIDLLTHALTFGDKLVVDALIPKRVVVFVNGEETIGPILMEVFSICMIL